MGWDGMKLIGITWHEALALTINRDYRRPLLPLPVSEIGDRRSHVGDHMSEIGDPTTHQCVTKCSTYRRCTVGAGVGSVGFGWVWVRHGCRAAFVLCPVVFTYLFFCFLSRSIAQPMECTHPFVFIIGCRRCCTGLCRTFSFSFHVVLLLV